VRKEAILMGKWRGIIQIALFFMLSFMLAGCSQEEIYNHAVNNSIYAQQLIKDAGNGDIVVGSGTLEGTTQAVDDAIAAGTGYMSNASKEAGIYIIAGSEIIGIILFIISSRTRSIKLKKSAIMVFILGIPLMIITVIYGLAILAGWFS